MEDFPLPKRLRQIAAGEENPTMPLIHRDVILRAANRIEELEEQLKENHEGHQRS